MAKKSAAFVKDAVATHSVLSLQVNKGQRHRITRLGLKRGSLWVTPYTDGYRLALSGNVKTILGPKVISLFGGKRGDDQDRIFWHLTYEDNIKSVISEFAVAAY